MQKTAQRRLARLRSESAMTLVEVMVAVMILLVGVLGTVTMIDGANATTSTTKAREGATHLGRQVLEVARSVPYRNLTSAAVEAQLTARPGLADSKPASAGYQITSRKFTYDVAISVCSRDDPKDRLGVHDATVAFCPDSGGLPPETPSTDPQDRNPDDFRRVAVSLSWRSRPGAMTDTTRQTTIVTNPVGGLGPSVIELKPDAGVSNPITGAETTAAKFRVKTDLPAAEVSWSINGAHQGIASGSGTEWTFEWPLVKADESGNYLSTGSPTFFDGTSLLQAEAFDDEGRSGTVKPYTMVVNRIPPLAPGNVEAGRNLNQNRVDIEWHASPEPDVLGYRVYRSETEDELGERVDCLGPDDDAYTTKTSCLDEDAPAPLVDGLGVPVPSLYYTVLAVDRASEGGVREGQPTAAEVVLEGNTAPTTPVGLTACSGGAPGCDDADGEPAPTGTTVLAWNPSTDLDGIKFYRVYRGTPPEAGDTYERRYDRLYPEVGKPLIFLDGKPENGPHEYRISAVDEHLGESELSDPVTR